MQTSKGISIEEVALYMKPYSHFKSTYEKIREKIRPPLSDFESFDGEIKLAYTLTVNKEPFLRYDNRSPTSRIIIFISDHGVRMLGQATRWHTDGTFFAAPKPFMQVYLLHAYDLNDNMVPCGYVLLQRKDKATYIQMHPFQSRDCIVVLDPLVCVDVES